MKTLARSGDEEKRRFWQVDPEIYNRDGRVTTIGRVLSLLRSLGKWAGFLLIMSYPILLVYLGIAYGGLVFWGSFASSLLIIGIVLSRLGYGKRFEGPQTSLPRKLGALTLSFLIYAGFLLGLFQFRQWIVPIMFAALSVGLTWIVLRRKL